MTEDLAPQEADERAGGADDGDRAETGSAAPGAAPPADTVDGTPDGEGAGDEPRRWALTPFPGALRSVLDTPWTTVAAAVVLAVPLIVGLIDFLARPWLPVIDDAMAELRALDVPGHLPLVGAFSRYGFSHPGPLLYYLLAIPVHLFGPKGMGVTAFLVNLGAVIGCAVLLRRRGGNPMLVWGSAVLLLLLHGLAAELMSSWNPWIGTTSFALAMLLGWSVLERDWVTLPILAGVSTLLVQLHLGYAPLVAGLAVPAAAYALWTLRPGAPAEARCPTRLLAITGAVLVVLWLPPLVEQFTNDPGNISAILDSRNTNPDPPVGWSAALDVFGREFGLGSPWITGNDGIQSPAAGAVFGEPFGKAIPLLVVFVATLGAAMWRKRWSAVRFQSLVALQLPLALWATASINGLVFNYIVKWAWVIAAFCWLASGWSAWSSLADLVRPRVPKAVTEWLPVGAAVVLVGLTTWTSIAVARAPLAKADSTKALLTVIDPVTQQLPKDATILMQPAGKSFREVYWGMLAELERRGFDVLVPDTDTFQVGEHRGVGDTPVDGVLVVAVGKDAIQFQVARGATLLGAYPGLTDAERTELQELRTKGFFAQAGGEPLTDAELARATTLSEKSEPVSVFYAPGDASPQLRGQVGLPGASPGPSTTTSTQAPSGGRLGGGQGGQTGNGGLVPPTGAG